MAELKETAGADRSAGFEALLRRIDASCAALRAALRQPRYTLSQHSLNQKTSEILLARSLHLQESIDDVITLNSFAFERLASALKFIALSPAAALIAGGGAMIFF